MSLPQGTYTFDAYTITLTADKANVSDVDRSAARWLPGLVSGSVVMSGTYSTNTDVSPQGLGLVSGNEYSVRFALSDDVGVTFSVQIETCRITQRVNDVAKVEAMGVINSDFLADGELIDLLDEYTIPG